MDWLNLLTIVVQAGSVPEALGRRNQQLWKMLHPCLNVHAPMLTTRVIGKFHEKPRYPFLFKGSDMCEKYSVFLFNRIYIYFLKVVNVGQEPIARPDRHTQSPVTMATTAMTMEWTPPQVLVSPDISAMDHQFLPVRVYWSIVSGEKLIDIITETLHQGLALYFRRSHRRRLSSGTLL